MLLASAKICKCAIRFVPDVDGTYLDNSANEKNTRAMGRRGGAKKKSVAIINAKEIWVILREEVDELRNESSTELLM